MLATIAVALLVGESFPFSRFHMYAKLPAHETYVYVADPAGHPVPLRTEFGVRGSFLKKHFRTARLQVEEEWGGAVRPRSSSEEAAERALRYLVANRRPRTENPTSYSGLRLYQVRVALNDGQVKREPWLLAEIRLP